MGFLDRLKRLLRFAERREHARHGSDTLHLVVGGRTYRSVDWSLGGVRVAGLSGDHGPGDRIEGELRYGSSSGRFVAEVVNVLASGEVGLRFVDISPGVYIAMSRMLPR